MFYHVQRRDKEDTARPVLPMIVDRKRIEADQGEDGDT